MTDADLYRRGTDTLIASWEAYARAASGAALLRSAGVAIAVFPTEPECSIYNNALLDRGLPATDRDAARGAVQAAYSGAGVGRFAVWVHESDEAILLFGAPSITFESAWRAQASNGVREATGVDRFGVASLWRPPRCPAERDGSPAAARKPMDTGYGPPVPPSAS